MAQNAWMWKSFVVGFVLVPLIGLLISLALMRSTAAAAPPGAPVTIVRNHFIDVKTPSGGAVSLSAFWLLVVVAMCGGLASLVLTAVGRLVWLR